MKRLFAFALTLVMVLCLVSCQATNEPASKGDEGEAVLPEKYEADALIARHAKYYSGEDSEPRNTETCLYTYDERGVLQTIGEETGLYTDRFTYDEAGRLLRSERVFSDSEECHWTEYTYDEAGRLIRERSGKDTACEYEYDDAGRVCAKLFYDAFSESADRREVLTYDERGLFISSVMRSCQTDELVDEDEYRYTLDEAGRVILMERLEPDYEDVAAEKQEYTYDAEGRLVAWVRGELALNDYAEHGTVRADAWRLDLAYDESGRITGYVCQTQINGLSERTEVRYEYGKIEVAKEFDGADFVEYDPKKLDSALLYYLSL